MIVVGISGKKSTGKSTAAGFLCKEYDFVCISMADEIKRTAQRWFGFSYQQLWGDSVYREETPVGNPTGPTARKVTQFLGTEVGRLLDSNVWIDQVANILARLAIGLPSSSNLRYDYDPNRGLYTREGWAPPPVGVVIPDVRFKNEIEAVKEWNGVLVRIKRPVEPEDDASAHASETEQDEIPDSDFNLVINNDATIPYLRAKILSFVKELEDPNG
jgi:hypothetical protein